MHIIIPYQITENLYSKPQVPIAHINSNGCARAHNYVTGV